MIKVEQGVPFPIKRKIKAEYPIETMEVGESFAVTGIKAIEARQVAYAANRKGGKRFTCRSLGPDGTGTAYRIWRTA